MEQVEYDDMVRVDARPTRKKRYTTKPHAVYCITDWLRWKSQPDLLFWQARHPTVQLTLHFEAMPGHRTLAYGEVGFWFTFWSEC